MKIWLLAFLIFLSQTAHASPASSGQKFFNFSAVYASQWIFYLVTQRETIEERGSFKNFLQHPFQPHFDKDHFSYNVFRHTLAGSYYYLFYRSQGYEVKQAFFWSTISSLAFEFSIETVTERPSLQDIYQTPVFGTLAGMMFESGSDRLLSLQSPVSKFFGYVLNPFKLFDKKDPPLSLTPTFKSRAFGLLVTAEF